MQTIREKCMKMAKGEKCARTDRMKIPVGGTDGRGMIN
jgi:hypothetical protein